MMKFSLLQSLFFFFTIILLQGSWCLAIEGSNGEKLATLPQSQGNIISTLCYYLIVDITITLINLLSPFCKVHKCACALVLYIL